MGIAIEKEIEKGVINKRVRKQRIKLSVIDDNLDKLDENGFYPEEAAELKRRAEDVKAGIKVKYALIED